jgi:hypothetical protein
MARYILEKSKSFPAPAKVLAKPGGASIALKSAAARAVEEEAEQLLFATRCLTAEHDAITERSR